MSGGGSGIIWAICKSAPRPRQIKRTAEEANRVVDCFVRAGIVGRSCTCGQGYVGTGVGVSGCVAAGSPGGVGPCAGNPCGYNGRCQV